MQVRNTAPRPGRLFWLAWVLATVSGAVVCLILAAPLEMAVFAVLNFSGLSTQAAAPPGPAGLVVMLLISAVSPAIMGAAFGLGQWLVLRRALAGTGGWVLATLVGYPATFMVQRFLHRGELPIACGVMLFLAFGGILGVLQWLVLSRRVPRAGLWIVISLAGWVLAFILIGAVEVSGLYVEPFDMVAALLVPTIVSGAGMVWLLRRTSSEIIPAEL